MFKRGQFFLVAALVISGILIGLAGVYTQVNAPKENTALYDAASELNYESLQVIDQCIYNDLQQDCLSDNLEAVISYYINKDPKSDFIIIYGNSDEVKIKTYNANIVGYPNVGTGAGTSGEVIIRPQVTTDTDSNTDEVSILLGDQVLKFKLGPGQQFYSVVRRVEGDQTFVAVGG